MEAQTLFDHEQAPASAPAATADLLDAAAEAALFLKMGDGTDGLAAWALADMRGRLVDAVHELERSWAAETDA